MTRVANAKTMMLLGCIFLSDLLVCRVLFFELRWKRAPGCPERLWSVIYMVSVSFSFQRASFRWNFNWAEIHLKIGFVMQEGSSLGFKFILHALGSHIKHPEPCEYVTKQLGKWPANENTLPRWSYSWRKIWRTSEYGSFRVVRSLCSGCSHLSIDLRRIRTLRAEFGYIAIQNSHQEWKYQCEITVRTFFI